MYDHVNGHVGGHVPSMYGLLTILERCQRDSLNGAEALGPVASHASEYLWMDIESDPTNLKILNLSDSSKAIECLA